METFCLDIQIEVRKQICPEHQTSPSIKIIDGHIDLICCCVAFKIECYKLIIEALNTYKIEHPLAEFKVKPTLLIAYKKRSMNIRK